MRPCPILLFIKHPDRGHVKSRLAATVGVEAALDLYKSFIHDILRTIEVSGHPCTIFFSPPDAAAAVSAWLGSLHRTYPQEGTGLGERMANAFARAFNDGASRAILIGSDIPDLPVTLLHDAFEALSSHDGVIGPATDGGYYLIGFRSDSFLPEVFQGIRWSTSTVFEETMQLLGRAPARVHVLPMWSDIDTLDDLAALRERNRHGELRASSTMASIERTPVSDALAEAVRRRKP